LCIFDIATPIQVGDEKLLYLNNNTEKINKNEFQFITIDFVDKVISFKDFQIFSLNIICPALGNIPY